MFLGSLPRRSPPSPHSGTGTCTSRSHDPIAPQTVGGGHRQGCTGGGLHASLAAAEIKLASKYFLLLCINVNIVPRGLPSAEGPIAEARRKKTNSAILATILVKFWSSRCCERRQSTVEFYNTDMVRRGVQILRVQFERIPGLAARKLRELNCFRSIFVRDGEIARSKQENL